MEVAILLSFWTLATGSGTECRVWSIATAIAATLMADPIIIWLVRRFMLHPPGFIHAKGDTCLHTDYVADKRSDHP